MVMRTTETPALRVVSFGYGHGTPPTADITVDVRDWFRDPHINPAMRELTGLDDAVFRNVVEQPGAEEVVHGVLCTARHLLSLNLRPVTVAFGCVGGRHRSVVLAEMTGERARQMSWPFEVVHRDVDKPVLASTRPAGAADRAGGQSCG